MSTQNLEGPPQMTEYQRVSFELAEARIAANLAVLGESGPETTPPPNAEVIADLAKRARELAEQSADVQVRYQ